MDVNELIQSLSGEAGRAAAGPSGDTRIDPAKSGKTYVTRQEIMELRRDLCELLGLLLNLHVTSSLDVEVPYMDIYLN